MADPPDGVRPTSTRCGARLGELGSVVVAFSGGADSASWPGSPATRSGPTGPSRSPPCRRRSPPRSGPTAEALAASGACGGRRCETDELADPAYARQRRRALLPLQDRAAWTSSAPLAEADGRHRRARREPRRPRRPPARPAGRGRAGRRRSRWSTPASPRPTSATRRGGSGLRTWDKPAAACLASRVPYGTPVTIGVLDAVARAEAGLRALGFRRAARAPLRRPGPARGAARRPARRSSPAATRSSPRCGRPATATSPSTSRASAPATSTPRSTPDRPPPRRPPRSGLGW